MTRHVQVRLEADEYQRFSDKAKKMFGTHPLQKAGRLALNGWVAGQANPFPDLNDQELEMLQKALRILRSKTKASEESRELLTVLLRAR